MENAIKHLRIQNFKSIKDVTLKPRRVNIIIGEPNVGKSNILEAMSLLGAGLYDRGDKFLGDVLRYETLLNLFYDNDSSQPVRLEADTGQVILAADETNGGYRFVQISEELWRQFQNVVKLQVEGIRLASEQETPEDALRQMATLELDGIRLGAAFMEPSVQASPYSFAQARVQEDGRYTHLASRYARPAVLPRKYVFRPGQPHNATSRFRFLTPPLGHNLLSIAEQNPTLRRQMAALFKPYGLSLVLRVGERKFEIQKQVEDLIYTYPYSLIADTLQRLIFYLAAIESNDNTVLLFEEPEAHSFPVYVSRLGRHIVESRNNQFFLITHSDYLVTEILEEMLTDDTLTGELAIFAAYYEDYQTKVHQLSDQEILDIRADGIDVFYNMERFTTGRENG